MDGLKEYFHTDWAAMTLHDWIGLIMTIVIFCLMVWAYVFALHPKNRDKLESQRHIPFEENDASIETENRK
ncbi:cbb3-type cytochrome c oxidase subunit 3 [Sedimenticola sp.]|uniref:cbb3-type cytochrome c oxidase subunit 3 n=1 Tax=Sedimenticola sp. TaxID=1940285 RepID=UPI003D11348F